MIFAVNCGPVFINCYPIRSELFCRISQYSTNFINTDFLELCYFLNQKCESIIFIIVAIHNHAVYFFPGRGYFSCHFVQRLMRK